MYFIWLFLLLNLSLVNAETVYKTEFSTGNYTDNQFNDEVLEIPDAYALLVELSGETEARWDVVTIYDMYDNKFGPYSGLLNESIEVPGSRIRFVFKADNRTDSLTHGFIGANVRITARDFTTLYQNIRDEMYRDAKIVVQEFTAEIANLLESHMQPLSDLDNLVRNSQSVDEIIPHLRRELSNMVRTYHNVVAMRPRVHQSHVDSIKRIEQLQRKITNYTGIARDNIAKRESQARASPHNWQSDALLRVARLLTWQLNSWQDALVVAQQLDYELRNYSNLILDLFNFLDISAQLYENAAHLLTARNTANLGNLVDLANLSALVQQIKQSEDIINDLLVPIRPLSNTDEILQPINY